MNVEDLLIKNKIYTKESGSDFLIHCLNPDHDDNNPSLRVDKLSGKMHCFSCGFSGNIFSFFNVAKNLNTGKVLQLQEKIRNIKSAELSIPLGHLPFEEDGYRGISVKTFKEFQAFTHVEQWPDRVVFPIRNFQGQITKFVGRYIWSDADPKYLMLPRKGEVPLFPHKVEPIDGSVVLVEGIFDFLNLYDKGLKNVVCCFGTSTLYGRNGLSKILPYKLMGVTTISILFDSGAEKQAEKVAKTLNEHFIVNILDISKYQKEKNEDPGDFSSGQVRKLRNDLYESSSS